MNDTCGFSVESTDAEALAVKNLTIPDDPRAALLAISNYLKIIRTSDENRFPFGGDKREPFGYVISTCYVYGLRKIQHEAERIAKAEQ